MSTTQKVILPQLSDDHTTISQVLLINRMFSTFVQTPEWTMMSDFEKQHLCQTMWGINTYSPGAAGT